MKNCFKKLLNLAILLTVLTYIPGCGSSGSSSNSGEDETYSIDITLENLTTGQRASVDEAFTMGIDQEGLLTARVTDSGGSPAPGRLVTAAFTDGTCQFLNTTDGSMATDANGTVTMRFTLVTGITDTGETITITSDVPVDSTSEAPTALMSFTIDPSNQAGTIEFISATPTLIGLTGTTNLSDLPSQSILEFMVKDNQTNPVYGQMVNFSLSTDMGGITMVPTTAETDFEGKVSVVVKSGNVPTAVRVRADVADTSLYTLSNDLTLSTGFPDQNSFSISVDTFNPEALNLDGTAVAVTARAGDINNNPVPDGTAIYFTTEGGVIDSTCFTENGACSVEWRSQNPRPADGLVTILAYAQGEESFQDLNGTGRYEEGADQLLTDLPEAYLDASKDNDQYQVVERDWDEIFIDFNNDTLYTPADGLYNGTLCDEGVAGCTSSLVHVRDDILIVMAESYATIIFTDTSGTTLDNITFNSDTDVKVVRINVTGYSQGNAMPSGTTVAVTAPENSTITGESSFTVKNAISPSPFTISLQPSDSEDVYGTTQNLLVEVTSPSGVISSAALSIKNALVAAVAAE